MTTVKYSETTATPRIASLPMAHLSIELGHLYMDDFVGDESRLPALFRQVAPWAATARAACEKALARASAPGSRAPTARISTCFLVDDYFQQLSSPAEVLPRLIEAADDARIPVDYIVRESACAHTGDLDLAGLVAGRLVADPPPGSNGLRPPPSVTGWLSNGQRSPQPQGIRALRAGGWQPPAENGANRHSIFVDVQLWSETPEGRLWSCPFLASVWQLVRLGLLRNQGEPVVTPEPRPRSFPELWSDLPPVMRLNDRAQPFTAYRTASVLGRRFLPVEVAVRTILSQVAVESDVAAQALGRAAKEGLSLPAEVVDRIDYSFTGEMF